MGEELLPQVFEILRCCKFTITRYDKKKALEIVCRLFTIFNVFFYKDRHARGSLIFFHSEGIKFNLQVGRVVLLFHRYPSCFIRASYYAH